MEIIVMMLVSVLIALGTALVTCHWVIGELPELIYKEMVRDANNSFMRDEGLATVIDTNSHNIRVIAKAIDIDKALKSAQRAVDAVNVTVEDTKDGADYAK